MQRKYYTELKVEVKKNVSDFLPLRNSFFSRINYNQAPMIFASEILMIGNNFSLQYFYSM